MSVSGAPRCSDAHEAQYWGIRFLYYCTYKYIFNILHNLSKLLSLKVNTPVFLTIGSSL